MTSSGSVEGAVDKGREEMSSARLVKEGLGMVVVLLILTIVSLAQAPVPEPVTDQETELGQAVYKQLQLKGEIINSSPLYMTL